MFKQVIAIVLLLCISATLLSCANNTGNLGVINTDVTSPQTTNAVDEHIPFPHEIRDFEGYTFKIMIVTENVNTLDVEDYDIEEVNGEVLNDALYNRLRKIEDTFNINFEATHYPDFKIIPSVEKVVKAGSDDCDAFIPRLMNAASAATKGLGYELTQLENLSLDKPWWDKNAVSDLSIDNKLYILAGDVFIKHYDGISLLFFNKRLIADLGLEDPYTLVRENKWTLDKFNEMCAAAVKDINGDGKMDKEDQFGLSTQADYVTSMLNGSGVKFIEKDTNDLPIVTINQPKTTVILDKIVDHYKNSTWCLHRDAGAASLSQFWVFPQGKSLFLWALSRYMNLGLRSMDDDFGILPIPKFDSSQERYYHTLNAWHSYTYMLPISSPDIERSAYIVDALAYYGREYVLPAYYEVCLTRKYTRDDESSDMLDIIFNSTVYDLGDMYNFGGLAGDFSQQIQKNNINFTSTFEKLEAKVNKDIQNIIEVYNNMQ